MVSSQIGSDDIEAAVAAAQARSEKVKASVESLRDLDAQGRQASRTLLVVVGSVVSLIFVGVSAVLLSDPRARPAYCMLVMCLALLGVYSYYRHQRGGT
jgi:hypothetical protein